MSERKTQLIAKAKELKQKLLAKYRGIPLIAIILLTTTIVTVSAIWFTFGWINLITYDGVSNPPTTIDGSDTFEIKDTVIPPDILHIETTLDGNGNIGGTFSATTVLTLLDTNYALLTYTVQIEIISPTSVVVDTVDISGEQLDETNTVFTCALTGINTTEVGTHIAKVSVLNMLWVDAQLITYTTNEYIETTGYIGLVSETLTGQQVIASGLTNMEFTIQNLHVFGGDAGWIESFDYLLEASKDAGITWISLYSDSWTGSIHEQSTETIACTFTNPTLGGDYQTRLTVTDTTP